jgi:hypothetical protein
MLRTLSCTLTLLLAAGVASADTPADKKSAAHADAKTANVAAPTDNAGTKTAKAESDEKTLSGMSILGNQEAPKALVIVPWKSSQLGNQVGLSKTLDDGRQPVDKDVFMRELEYYEIRAGEK